MDEPVLSLRGASLSYGERELWHGLDLDVNAGEFLAVLGPNGTGKTSLLRTILGQERLTSGEVRLLGHPARRGNPAIGYIPQHRLVDHGAPLRARDLVAFGVTGSRLGPPLMSRQVKQRVDEALAAVGATAYGSAPVASLSGGEQQRIRVAQSIIGHPALLLCDEPLLSLDLAHQRGVSELIDAQRKRGAAVVFVTHDVNPVLEMVDRVLYLAAGQFRVGTPKGVLRSDVLSELYGTPVDVFESHGRIVVVGGGGDDHHHHHEGGV